MALDEDVVLRDVTNAGVVISDRIAREAATQLDLEEALEASRYASDPYTTHPREVILNLMDFFIFYFGGLMYLRTSLHAGRFWKCRIMFEVYDFDNALFFN